MGFLRGLAGILAALAFVLPCAASAEERILFFGSDIAVQQDSSLQVSETIRVQAEGAQINHGIYRDFPVKYRTLWGTTQVGFEVHEVLRDGRPEPWSASSFANGIRVKIGDAETEIEPGIHDYVIRYRTTRQLGFFEGYDELYWNVTGNGWGFPIDVATARIRLPRAAPFGQRSVYTGPEGATGRNAEVTAEAPGDIGFRTTVPLGPQEGFTVAVAFPKDVVSEPDADDSLATWLKDHATLIVGLLGLVGILAYYVFAWLRAGRDPAPGTVVPLFSPPDGLSPAAMRYIVEMGSDNRAFAAALIDLGVQGKVKLVEGEKGFFSKAKTTIEKTGDVRDLRGPEAQMVEALFRSGSSILMDNDNHKDFRSAQSALDRGFKSLYEGKMFVRNWMWSIRGVFLLIVAMVCTAIVGALTAPINPGALSNVAPLGLLAIVVAAALFMLPVENSALRMTLRILGGLAGLAALGLGVICFGIAMETGPALPVLVPLASLPFVISAFSWMAAPTKQGRQMLDRIAGFRQYLSIAEEDRLERMHPPEKTPALFEKYLPYAVALEVENDWADRFASVLAAAAVAGQSRQFGWYAGHSDPWNQTGRFVDQIGSSLSSNISSASTAPGSSSGSGGGGSSGGGGGGGGGGGW